MDRRSFSWFIQTHPMSWQKRGASAGIVSGGINDLISSDIGNTTANGQGGWE